MRDHERRLALIDFLKKYRYACLGVGLFLASMVVVFWAALPMYAGLVAPDSMPYFPKPWRTSRIIEILTSGTFTPHNLYWLIFNPLYAHELTYIIDSLVLALGGVYYLRTQRVHPLAAWFGGLALGLSGYTFTLFSAGHRGYFHMFSCAVWAFGFIARGFETRRLIYFALIGLVFAWGVLYQPDVLLLVGALAATYVLWRTGVQGEIRSQELGVKRGRGVLETALKVWPRFMVSVLVLVLAGYAGIRAAVTTQIAGRDAQIAGSSGKAAEAAGKPGERTPEEERERWLFATGWSLPPEDVLEFLVPGVFGNDSMQPPFPYWGRLGRPDDSVFQKGRMMPNYRQHTVYLGLIPLLFAVFAVLARCRKKHGGEDSEQRAAMVDLPFWCGVWVVCLLLAFGRFTPVYRLFYAIPYMDYIRAPVKFLHLVEIATAFLAGFGMDAFLRTGQPALRRKMLWLTAGAAGVLLVGAGVALAAKTSITGNIAALGIAQFAEALGGYTVRNTMRAVLFAGVAAGAVAMAVRGGAQSARRVTVVAAGLLILAVLDQTLVARRYVRTINLEPLYHENAVVKAIHAASGGRPANVINYATPNAEERDWFSTALIWNGIRNMAPTAHDAPYRTLFESLQGDSLHLWRVLNVQYVVVPRKGTEELVRSGKIRPMFDFELGSGIVKTVTPSEQSLMLAAVGGSAPSAGVRAASWWEGSLEPAAQPARMVKSGMPVSQAPAPAGEPPTHSAAQSANALFREQPSNLETRLVCTNDTPMLVLFNERYKEDTFEVLIDGQAAPCYVSDGIWASAVVPGGEHQVVFRKKRHTYAAAWSAGTSLVMLVLALLYGCGVFGKRAIVESVA